MNKRTNTKTSKYNHNRLTMLGKECGLLDGELYKNKVEPIQTTKNYKYKKNRQTNTKSKKTNAKKRKQGNTITIDLQCLARSVVGSMKSIIITELCQLSLD